jgi:hypothetical protein
MLAGRVLGRCGLMALSLLGNEVEGQMMREERVVVPVLGPAHLNLTARGGDREVGR